jgi:serine/threonine protein phosphatase PrpC
LRWRGAQIVCLPELFRSRYFCQSEDHAFFNLAEPIPGPSTEALAKLARKHEITRVLGYSRNIVPDLHYVKLYAGDNILLCSDGLCGVLPSAEISETVISAPNPNKACLDLTARANLAGGQDNISVIVVKPDNLPSWQAMVTAETSMRRT